MYDYNDKFVKEKMQELDKYLEAKFKDITWLAKAMCATKLPKTGNKNYFHDTLATLGDSLLHTIICDNEYNEENSVKKEDLTKRKQELANNTILYDFAQEEIIHFAYHKDYFYDDAPKENQVRNPREHTPYVEAIIGAFYKSNGFEDTKLWVNVWLLPKLKK